MESPILLSHANVSAVKRRTYYPVTHPQIKIFTESSGTQQVSIYNAILEPIPERILIAFVKNTVFVGSASTNPFHLHHYDMTNLVFFVNGVQNPSESLKIDCSSTFLATSAYVTLFSSTGIHHDDRAHMIKLEMFKKVFLHIRIWPDIWKRTWRTAYNFTSSRKCAYRGTHHKTAA